jgi:integrase
MATVKILLNKRYESKDGCQVVFRIGHQSTNTTIDTGIKVPKKFWDNKKFIKKNAPGIIDNNYSNTQLQKELYEIQTFIAALTASGDIYDLTASQIKGKYINHKAAKDYNFSTYFDYFISMKTGKTKETYEYTHSVIKKYKLGDMTFADVNMKFLREFETHLKDKGIRINSIGIHMRNIRAVFNTAIDDEIIDLNLYPFRKFKIKKENTIKRNLTIDEMKRFKNVELMGVPSLARDVFMLSFYLIGINLKDLVHLTKDNIKDGRIEYRRRKGGKDYSIKLEPEAKALIRKLRGQKYLINVLEKYACYENAIKEIDKKLKVVATKAKINKPVSIYYARHSWATIASGIDISKDTISAALGHETGSKTTAIYIDYDRKKVDKANRQVIDLL